MRQDLAGETRARLESIGEIPSLPTVLSRVWELTAKDDTSASDLATAISADPGLTGAVLRLANSAYFGFPRKVSTVTQAIVILGFSTVKSLVAGASVFRALGTGGRGGIDGGAFLSHSLAVAMASRVLIERRAPQKSGTAFACGILHDLGKLVIAEFLGDAPSEIAQHVRQGMALEEAEVAVLGLSHAEIGSWFATRWNFPEELACAVRWHHRPGDAAMHRDFVAAVHVGDALAHRHGIAADRVREDAAIADEALHVLGIDAGVLEHVSGVLAEAAHDGAAAGLSLEG